MKATKKPVTIETIQLTKDNFQEIKDFINHRNCTEHYNNEHDFLTKSNPVGLFIPTLEGHMLAIIGDYIIKGVKGEFYPCKPDIFEMTYDIETNG